MSIQLLHGDCLDLMKTLPDKSVDLFVCDLPYGCLTGGAGQEKRKREGTGGAFSGGCAWDIPIDLTAFWVQVKRLCRNDHTPVLMFCSTKFGFELYNSNPSWFRYDIVWSKPNGVGFLSANKMPLRSHEMVYVFAKKGANYYRKDIEGEFPRSHSRGNAIVGTTNTYNGGNPLPIVEQRDNSTTRCVKSVVEVSNKKGKGQHPTQKPTDLYRWLIERYSKEGDTILDPTAGSFSSCFVAHELGRNAIGMEKDDAFYEKARSSKTDL